MKKNEQIQKLVNLMVKASIKDGKISEASVKKCKEAISSLPKVTAILVLNAYIKGLKREISRNSLNIYSAIELTDKEVKQVVESVIDDSKKDLTIKTEVDSSLFGGLRVKIGDVVYDGSVLERINQLQNGIATQGI